MYSENRLVAGEAQKEEGERPLLQLEADLAADGRFGRRMLEVTSKEVRVCESNGAISLYIPLAEIVGARNEPLVGGGQLEITTCSGEVVPIITYSLTLATRFSEAARGIEQLARGEPLIINLEQKQLRCSKCGRLLPEVDGICPACIHRWSTLRRVAGYLLPYRLQAAALAFLGVLTTLLNLVPPKLQSLIIDRVFTPHRNYPFLLEMAAIWLGVVVAATAVQILNGRLIAYLAGHLAADLRAAVYHSVEFLQVSYFDKKQVGSIVSRVTQDTERIWAFLVDGMPFLLSNALMLLGIACVLFWINWRLTLAILAPMPVVVMLSAVFWKPISQMFFRLGQKWARVHTHLNESITGIRIVKAFVRERSEFSKFQARNKELRDAGIQADSRWYTVFGAMTFFIASGALINWTYGGWMVYKGQMSLGEFVMVNSLLGLVYGPLMWFGDLNQWFSRAMAGAERIFEVIDAEPEPHNRGGIRHAIVGEVAFEGVRFGYDKSNPVLKGLTFTVKPGEMIGLVGKSGAGKSTTINLICRFYEPDAGVILIDGLDYRTIALDELRRQIGIVPQEPFLFHGTIADNIAYGQPDASFKEIVEAAKAANAHQFILSKPDGYDTVVGERGTKISGGERQRLAIARAILHDPRILILDEATSSVDVETEKQIQEALARLVKGRTTFAIAHRLSTLRNADRLIVLEKGEIVEMGTHAELMERQGVFYQLVHTQSQVTQIIGVGVVE